MRNILGYNFLMMEHSDMKWPCPNGFHVPLESEWNAVLNTIVTLEWLTPSTAGVTTIATHLYLPLAWIFSPTGTSPQAWYYRQYWRYLSATAFSEISDNSTIYYTKTFSLRTSSPYYEIANVRRAFGGSIRAFKDAPVIPDNTRTTIFDGSSTATWAWIFRNATEWLISLSLDWENRITIADKNVWATAVWTYTTATTWYTAAKCGSFFQRWNNYPQPRTSSGSYSPNTSTKIDTTGYWPWNYFYQDIAVKISTSPDSDWSSVDNPNLWGWVSQGTWKEIKRL